MKKGKIKVTGLKNKLGEVIWSISLLLMVVLVVGGFCIVLPFL